MSEHCPLPPGETVIASIPGFCMEHCTAQWEEAMRSPGEYDDYKASTKECNHGDHEVGHSHEALHRPDDGASRIYALVEQCQGCYTELGETSHGFECSYSTPEVDKDAFLLSRLEKEIAHYEKWHRT